MSKLALKDAVLLSNFCLPGFCPRLFMLTAAFVLMPWLCCVSRRSFDSGTQSTARHCGAGSNAFNSTSTLQVVPQFSSMCLTSKNLHMHNWAKLEWSRTSKRNEAYAAKTLINHPMVALQDALVKRIFELKFAAQKHRLQGLVLFMFAYPWKLVLLAHPDQEARSLNQVAPKFIILTAPSHLDHTATPPC